MIFLGEILRRRKGTSEVTNSLPSLKKRTVCRLFQADFLKILCV
jgi:hypothetical protein